VAGHRAGHLLWLRQEAQQAAADAEQKLVPNRGRLDAYF
jgi:hypothetical protein